MSCVYGLLFKVQFADTQHSWEDTGRFDNKVSICCNVTVFCSTLYNDDNEQLKFKCSNVRIKVLYIYIYVMSLIYFLVSEDYVNYILKKKQLFLFLSKQYDDTLKCKCNSKSKWNDKLKHILTWKTYSALTDTTFKI